MTALQCVYRAGCVYVTRCESAGYCTSEMAAVVPTPPSSKDELVQYLRVCADLASGPKDGIAHVAIAPLQQAIQLLESPVETSCDDLRAQRDKLASYLSLAIGNIQGIADGIDLPSIVIRDHGRALLASLTVKTSGAGA